MQSFELGRIEITPAAAAALEEAGLRVEAFLDRHRQDDWGEVDDHVRRHNAFSLQYSGLIRSSYNIVEGIDLLVNTSRDRSYTRVLLADEFENREASAQEGYAQWAAYYDLEGNPLIAVEDPLVDAILQELAVSTRWDAPTALDVAAGTGRLALKLARMGVEVTAIDPSPEMLSVARDRAFRLGLDITFHSGSFEEGLPFERGAFDLATCALSLCHVPDLYGAVRELACVVRPGGYLLITDFHPEGVAIGWRTTVTSPDVRYLLPNMPHTREDYLAAVQQAGFVLVDVRDVPVREVPEGCFAHYEEIVAEYGNVNLCLVVLARKPEE
jgi:ubiquinone/menaquinone biosynthesis C-methylase UbiE